MKFGRVNTSAAEGGILAHSVKLPTGKLGKGIVLSSLDVQNLQTAGINDVVIARLEADDISEDEAARRIASAIAGENAVAGPTLNGRCNMHAAIGGLLLFNSGDLVTLNLVDEALTIATLPAWSVVKPGQLVATIKIIPYGVRAQTVEQLVSTALQTRCHLEVRGFRKLRIGLLQTQVEGFEARILDKTRKVTARRLGLLGNEIAMETRCAHREAAIAGGIGDLLAADCKLILITGASASADRRDVVPQGIEQAGGRIIHMGMPVEPGNLLLLAEIRQQIPVICLPGCARSPALNGFDWVLERLLAGISVKSTDIMTMGAGGLIKGAPSRIGRTAGMAGNPGVEE
jgi:molybdenum cofactor cytidylyltransferase